MRNVGTALDRNVGDRTIDLEIVAARHALRDFAAGGDRVEREPAAHHAAEVEGNKAHQALQAEHSQQFADTWVDLEDLTMTQVQRQIAGQRRRIDGVRAAAPVDVTGQQAFAIFQCAR